MICFIIGRLRKSVKWLAKQKKGRFYQQQTKVFRDFEERRGQGKPVTVSKMRYHLKNDKPKGYESFKGSGNWITKWCKRFNISHRNKNNSKNKSINDRIEKCKSFYSYAIQTKN